MQSAEEKLAGRWLQRLGLRPPVDVACVISGFASVIEEDIPIDADALLIRRGGHKPVVVLKRNTSETRRSFTLAHELGHLLIPWHTGSFVCKPDPHGGDGGASEFIHRELESEANRFAAEFLMPVSYVEALFAQHGKPGAMLAETTRAKISTLAASFKFLKHLPTGFFMMEVDRSGRVIRSGRTSGTSMSPPEPGSKWDPKGFLEMRAEISTADSSAGQIVWIDVRQARLARPDVGSQVRATEIVDGIFEDLGLSFERNGLLASINGVIGAANGMVKFHRSGDLYTILCDRFKGREHLERVVHHPRFREFLAARVHEIERRA